jgi:hypothetical protein
MAKPPKIGSSERRPRGETWQRHCSNAPEAPESDVRFTCNSGHKADITGGPLSARRRHADPSGAASKLTGAHTPQPASARNRIGGRELFAQNSPVRSGCTSMLGYWKLWIDCLKLGHEAQQVIAMRIARIARGGRGADAECRRMVSEKLAATTAAQSAAAAALAARQGPRCCRRSGARTGTEGGARQSKATGTGQAILSDHLVGAPHNRTCRSNPTNSDPSRAILMHASKQSFSQGRDRVLSRRSTRSGRCGLIGPAKSSRGE